MVRWMTEREIEWLRMKCRVVEETEEYTTVVVRVVVASEAKHGDIEASVRERERERIEIVMRNGYRLKILNCQRHFLVRYLFGDVLIKEGKQRFGGDQFRG